MAKTTSEAWQELNKAFIEVIDAFVDSLKDVAIKLKIITSHYKKNCRKEVNSAIKKR